MTCKDYFFRLLSRREYSANELNQKAKEKGYPITEIAEAIADLQDKDYQSDTRVIESMITSYQGKYGKSVIKRKCLEKGIASDLFEQIWQSQTEADEPDDLNNLKAKIERKYKLDTFQNIDPKTKTKLINYLKYRGFNPFELLEQWRLEEE